MATTIGPCGTRASGFARLEVMARAWAGPVSAAATAAGPASGRGVVVAGVGAALVDVGDPGEQVVGVAACRMETRHAHGVQAADDDVVADRGAMTARGGVG